MQEYKLRKSFSFRGNRPQHTLYFFPNGYGASVAPEAFFNAGNGKLELAVVEGTLNNYVLSYETSITDDILRNLSISQVNRLLRRIKLL